MANAALPDGLASLKAALDEAWGARSPGEQSARAETVAATQQAPAYMASDPLRAVRWRAALSGRVRPHDLLDGSGADDAHGLLDTIAFSFDRIAVADGWQWQMRARPREVAFREMVAEGAVAAAAVDAARVATDRAGVLLRSIIAAGGVPDEAIEFGGQVASADAPTLARLRVDLQAWLQAANWARAAADAGALPNLEAQVARDAIRRASALATQLHECDRLIHAGFFGYETRLARVQRFLDADVTGTRLPLLSIEGVGGAGKSTLLATLTRRHLAAAQAADAAILVQIDFDRLVFRNGGELELSFEVTRQIGLQAAAADAELAEQRREMRRDRTVRGDEGKDDYAAVESIAVGTDAFDYRVRGILQRYGIDRRRLILLLDTFEEWRRPDRADRTPSDQVTRIVGWLAGLREKMGLTNIRVVVSGRIGLDGLDDGFDLRAPIVLDGVNRLAARRIVRGFGLSRAETERLLAMVAGVRDDRWIPLTLLIAARLVQRLPVENRRAFLGSDGIVPPGFDDGMRQGVLYHRYLDHMDSGDVRHVAMPGLALRRVTVPIVRDLLAGPCGLGDVGTLRAAELFTHLEAEVWLVQRDGEALVHRPDVRAATLRLMAGDAGHAAQVRQIHVAAIDWYRSGPGIAELGPDAARREALYHELSLLDDATDLALLANGPLEPDTPLYEDLRALLPARGDFGPRHAAQLAFAVGDWDVPADTRYLPPSLRPTYLREVGMNRVHRGNPAGAIALIDAAQEAAPVDEPQWLAQAQVETLRWDERIARGGGYVARLATHQPAVATTVRLAHHVLRAFLAGDADDLDAIAGLVARGADDGAKTQRGATPAIVDTLYFLIVALGRARAATLGAEVPRMLVRFARQRSTGWRSVEAWHRAAVVARVFGLDEESAAALADTPAQTVFAGMLRPDPALLRDYADDLAASGAGTAATIAGDYARDIVDRTGRSGDLLLARPAAAAKRFAVMARDGSDAVLRLPRHARLLRIGEAELRPMVASAFAAAFAGRDGCHRLGAVLGDVLPLRPDDFAPDIMAAAGPRQRNAVIVRAVEFADRAGVMTTLLSRAGDAVPGALPLARITEGYRRWDDAAMRLIATLDSV